MTVSEALKGLRAHGDSWFRLRGFRFDRGRRAYGRRTDLGAEYVYLRLLSIGGDLRLDLSAAIRVESVVSILARATGVDPKTTTMMNTLWTAAESLDGWPVSRSRMPVTTPAELEHARAAVLAFAEEAALPHFRAVSTLADVDGILNSDPLIRCAHCAQPHRALQGIIAAKQVGRADFIQLVGEHRHAISSVDRGYHLPYFEAVLKLLDEETTPGT